MKLIPFYGHAWESNSYLLINGTDAILVDAGIGHREVLEQLKAESASLRYILLTHGHFDHTVSVDALRRETGAKLAVHTEDAEMLIDAEKSALYLFFGTRSAHEPADLTLSDGDTLPFGNTTVKVIHTPGHSRGSVCYLADDMLFSGDTLFDEGYGRYDLYGGNACTLVASLEKLQKMQPTLALCPGHGASSTLGAAIDNLLRSN